MLPNGEDEKPRVADARLVEQLCLYDWPGNVREVCQLSQQVAVLHASEPILRRSHLPARMLEPRFGPAPAAAAEPRSSAILPREPFASWVPKELDEDEHRREQALRALVQALRLHRGNLALAARELGISRQKGYRMLEELPNRELSALRARKARYGGE
jgi:DNA-binding NtrC family response regulator